MNRVRSIVNSLFTRHLFVSNVVASGGLMAFGDSIAQRLERIYFERKTGVTLTYDYRRTGRMLLIGLALGPVGHYWYHMLDKYIIGSGVKTATKKIVFEQVVASPLLVGFFLVGSDLLEGKTLADCRQELRQKFLTILLIDWCVWPPAQFINFYFLPTRFRVLYVSMVALCWDVFLCFMKHKDHHVVTVDAVGDK